MKTIKELKVEGYIGPDVSLKISLAEYRIAWKEDNEHFIFLYRNDFDYNKWKYSYTPKNLNIEKYYNWVKWKDILSFTGMESMEEFKKMPLTQQIYDLASYYGFGNVFESTSNGGININFEE